MMFFSNVVGRFVEARTRWPARLEDVPKFLTFVDGVSARNPPGALVLIDSREGSVLPQPVFNAFVDTLVHSALAPERAAILLPDSAIVMLQMNRMAKQLHRGELRGFREPTEAIAWLGERATNAELRRMVEFVATGAPPDIRRATG